jgi:hypothetical protein
MEFSLRMWSNLALVLISVLLSTRNLGLPASHKWVTNLFAFLMQSQPETNFRL